MYDSEEEIQKKRRNLLFIIGGVVLLIVLVIIFLLVRGSGKKETPKVVEKELSCELGVKDGIQPNAQGVYTEPIEVVFESVSPKDEKFSKQTIGTTDNPRNTDTFKITKTGKYTLTGYLQNSEGRKKTCTKTFEVSITSPTCELAVSKGTLGANEWYTSDVEVSFSAMNSGSESTSIVKYYIEKRLVDVETSETVETKAPNGNIEKFVVTDDQETELIGYVIDSNGMEGTCKIKVKKDTTKPTCKLKVVSGKLNSKGEYTDNPVIGFSETVDTVSDVESKGVGTSKNYTNETFAVTTEGKTKVTGYVKDNAGNEGTCTIEVKRPVSSSGGNQGGGNQGGGNGGGTTPTPQKQSNPTCTLTVSGTRTGTTFMGNATITLSYSTTNGAKIKSYGLAETKTMNGKNKITISTAGKHTVYGMVQDTYGNGATCQITFSIKGGSVLSTRAKVGDYVAYDAGNWTSTVGIPNSEGQFGGYTNGTSKSKSVRCLPTQEGTPSDGWVVLSVSGGKVTLVHAGTPECYYHSKNTQTSISKINGRASTYLNKTYAESARILNCGDNGVNCSSSSLSGIHITNTHYYLPTAKDGSSVTLLSVSYSGRVAGTSARAFGIRPVVVLKANVIATSGTGTKADPYRISI